MCNAGPLRCACRISCLMRPLGRLVNTRTRKCTEIGRFGSRMVHRRGTEFGGLAD
jgi:hypothetical protein